MNCLIFKWNDSGVNSVHLAVELNSFWIQLDTPISGTIQQVVFVHFELTSFSSEFFSDEKMNFFMQKFCTCLFI